MAINFPSNPTSGNTYTYGGILWTYNGTAWDKTVSGTGTTGVLTLNGYTGGVTLAAGNQLGLSQSNNVLTLNVIEGAGSDLDADLLRGVSGQRFIENLQSGILYGGVLSINAGNTATFDITKGAGIIASQGASLGAYPVPVITNVSWNAFTGVTLSGLTVYDISYIAMSSSGNIVQSNSPFTNASYESSIPLGAIIHPSRTYISFAKTYPHPSYGQSSQMDSFVRAFGPLKLSGHEISGYDSTLQLSRSSGSAYALGRNYTVDPNTADVVTDTGATPATTIYRLLRGATAGTFKTIVNSTVDPTNYDAGSGLTAAVPAGQYSIQRVFYYPTEPTVLAVYYGRATYNSIDTAKSAIPYELFSESADTADSAIFCAYLIIKSNITNFTDANAFSIVQAGLFRSTANVGSGGVAVANLDDLSDVTITSASNNQALVYDSGTAQWVNKSFTSLPVVTSFNGLTGAVTGVLSFNGLTGSVTGVASFNGLTGAVTGVTTGTANTFVALQSFTTGISASGGVTLAGNLRGTTATFTGLVSGSAGFSGSLTGNATSASTISITDGNTNATYYPVFVGGTGATAAYIDKTTTPFTYNPSLGTITLQNISANGNVSGSIVTGNISESIIGGGFNILTQGGSINLADSFGLGGQIILDTVGNISIGDISGSGNGNKLIINDGSSTINFNSFNITGLGNILTPIITGTVTLNGQTFTNVLSSLNGLTGAKSILAGTGVSVTSSNSGITLTNTGVQSFNGSTGAVTGVSRVNGFTGGITFAAGSNIGITYSGNIVTISASGLSAAASDFVTQGKITSNIGITSGADYVIPFVADFDPQGWYNASTKQFRPTIAGYYDVSFSVWFATGSTAYQQVNVQSRKNGTSYVISQMQDQTGSGFSVGGTRAVYLNGSTDYIDFTVYVGQSPSQTIQGSAASEGTWFKAFLISNNTPPTAYVSSFNGLTGAVTGVTTGTANTFDALQSFHFRYKCSWCDVQRGCKPCKYFTYKRITGKCQSSANFYGIWHHMDSSLRNRSNVI
jgi:hypothetical protein